MVVIIERKICFFVPVFSSKASFFHFPCQLCFSKPTSYFYVSAEYDLTIASQNEKCNNDLADYNDNISSQMKGGGGKSALDSC